MVSRPSQGELVVYATRRASIDALRLDDFRTGGVSSTPPAGRIRLFCAGEGLFASGIRVIGAGNIATNAVVRLAVGGAQPGTAGILGRRAVLEHCQVRQNNGGAGFFKDDELDLELIDCSVMDCQNGVLVTQRVVDTPTFLTIRGGSYQNSNGSGTQGRGISVTVTSNRAVVTVDGAIVTGNRGVGLQILPSASEFDADWEDRGPLVTNNRVYGNSTGAATANPQILLGSLAIDRIGGVCLGNYCRGLNEGVIQVLTLETYSMRGLSTHNVAPWAVNAKPDLPPATANAQLAFNEAIWSP
jgi:hypothetical protein